MGTKVRKLGYNQADLYTLLYDYVTNWNAFLIKLDADTGDTTWRNDYTISTIGPTYDKLIRPNAMPEGRLIDLLKLIRDNFDDLLTDMAADDGIAGTTIFTDEAFGSTSYLVDVSNAKIKKGGINQGALVDFLDQLLDKFGTVLAACDSDGTLTDTNYFSTYYVADVIEISSSSSSCRSSSSSCRSSSSSSSSSSSCRSSSSSSSSSSSCRSSSSSSSSCRSSSSSSSCRSSSSSSSSSSCRSSSSSSSSCRSSSSSSSKSSSSSSSSSCRSSSSSSSSSSKSSSSSSSSCRSSSSSSSSSQSVS